MGVIVAHYNNPGIGGAFRFAVHGSLNREILYVLESLVIVAVDLFMIISGYFQCRSTRARSRKVIELLVQLMVFETVLYAMKILFGQGEFSWAGLVQVLFPTDYFIVLYCVTYLLSPYINFALSKLTQKHFRNLLLLLFLLFSVQSGLLQWVEHLFDISLSSGSTYSIRGDQEGYNIVTFILCYLIGAGIRYGVVDVKKPLYSVLLFFAAFFMVWYKRNWSYSNPFVIIQAASLFILFVRLPIRDSAWINRLARASLTVYLLHQTLVVRTGIQIFVTGPAAKMCLHILAVAVGIYAVCFVVYLVWSKLTKPVFDILFSKIHIPDIDLGISQS